MGSPDRPLVILPAAGFGQRVGSPESKELLPVRNGEPLIDQPLKMCLERNWPVLVVTRKEKASLLKHLEKFESQGLEVAICLVEETRDWSESLLKSEGHWRNWNLVVLPDTEYEPKNIWDEMWVQTKDCDLVVAKHPVESSEAWGVLESTQKGLKVGEKLEGASAAWGLYIFRREWGGKVLAAQLESQLGQKWIQIEGCRVKSLGLDLFKDLTRGD